MSVDIEVDIDIHEMCTVSDSVSNDVTKNIDVKLDSDPTADLSMEFYPTPDTDGHSSLQVEEVSLSEIHLGAKYERKVGKIHKRTQDRIQKNKNDIENINTRSVPDNEKAFKKSKSPKFVTQADLRTDQTGTVLDTVEKTDDAPHMKTARFADPEAQTEFTMENRGTTLAVNLTDREQGGSGQSAPQNFKKIYFGGAALWWFITVSTCALLALVLTVWSIAA